MGTRGRVDSRSSAASIGSTRKHAIDATHQGPALVDDAIVDEVDACAALAPLHNPATPSASALPETRGAASRTSSCRTRRFTHLRCNRNRTATPPPKHLYDDHGIRRYGFHGTSHAYVTKQLAAALGKPVSAVNAIVCHLGSGASMCCVEHGRSIDTTMGLAAGGPGHGHARRGRRRGRVSVSIRRGYSTSDLDALLNKESGLKGASGGLASDMRAITKLAEQGDADAALARSVFVERCRKYVGAYSVKLKGRVDAIVFCGGIGERGSRTAVEGFVRIWKGCWGVKSTTRRTHLRSTAHQ